jgi:hypothetical protein
MMAGRKMAKVWGGAALMLGLISVVGPGAASAEDGLSVGPAASPTSQSGDNQAVDAAESALCVLPAGGGSVSCKTKGALFYNSRAYGYGSGTMWIKESPVGTQVRLLAISNLAGYKFISRGAGQGQYVKNNAAAGQNPNGRGLSMTVWYNSGFKGARDSIPAATTKDLVATKNENASLDLNYVT